MQAFNLSVWPVRLSTLILATMATASAAHWFLKWSEAPPVPPVQTVLPAAKIIDSARIALLLGAAAFTANRDTAAPVSNAMGKYKLLGVIAQGSQGSALIGIDGEPAKPYRVGDKLPGDLVLQSVKARSAALATSLETPVSVTLQLPPPTSSQAAK